MKHQFKFFIAGVYIVFAMQASGCNNTSQSSSSSLISQLSLAAELDANSTVELAAIVKQIVANNQSDELVSIAANRSHEPDIRVAAVKVVYLLDDPRRVLRIENLLKEMTELLVLHQDHIVDSTIALAAVDGAGMSGEQSLQVKLREISLDSHIKDDLVRAAAVSAWLTLVEPLHVSDVARYAAELGSHKGVQHLINYAVDNFGYDTDLTHQDINSFLEWAASQP